ncbi:hypothetical protein N7G274_002326 [Stereocaulon virgatum]|uniref:Peptidase M20 dimerisation domain-containing protein n=1 Tax=Stereocaulon virgatum TaxID=373712 RepID=A0ABR4AJI2_9LECA
MILTTMDPRDIVHEYRPDLAPFENVYRDIHRNPELSKQESRTANIVATHLETLSDFRVHRNIGGHGVVGVLRNGPGSTVLLRADMDALPYLENTGLEYASTKVMKDLEGNETPVMHACGHDMHTTTLMAAATLMHAAKEKWKGTLICLFQPDEELGTGAQAMVDDGLYDVHRHAIPPPDIVLSQHDIALKAGVVALSAGPVLTIVDCFEIRVFGKSGHISRADLCVDPIVTAAHIILRLQSLVTKEVRPEDFAVISCASMHGGSAPDIIPDFVDITVSIQSHKPEVHSRLLTSLRRIVRAECEASGSLAIKEPAFKTIMHTPPTINDPEHTGIVKDAFDRYFRDDCIQLESLGPSEDCSILATACGAPLVYTLYGCVHPKRWEEAVRGGKISEIPQYHSAFFAPAIQPTMTTAVDAFAISALAYLQ